MHSDSLCHEGTHNVCREKLWMSVDFAGRVAREECLNLSPNPALVLVWLKLVMSDVL